MEPFEFMVSAHRLGCDGLIWLALRFALGIVEHQRWGRRKADRLRGSLRRLMRAWLVRAGRREPTALPRFRRAWNRTPDHVEIALVRLHVEQPHLGSGQLAYLLERIHGARLVRETVRKILQRRRDLVTGIGCTRNKPKKKIFVSGPRRLWAVDLTLVWILGFWPAWVLGVVDLYGSRLLALERIALPRAASITVVLERAFECHGAPERLLSDNGPQFRNIELELFLVERNIEHTFTRPAHPWTNGRVERLFRTFKETIHLGRWLIGSFDQIDCFCGEFITFYNRDRPHSAYQGRTPDEVWFGVSAKRALGRVTYFDGALPWYRFG